MQKQKEANQPNGGLPKVSIITVVRNNNALIERCVRSVKSQTYPNIEYVVIDGQSDDGTLETLEGFGERIDKLISEPDDGIYDAMNKGLAHATGDLICFLNADDFYTPEAIEASVRHLTRYDLELSYAGFVYARSDSSAAALADEPRPWDASLLVQGMPGGHETILARREVYERIGNFDTSFRLAGDYDWVIRAFRAGVRARPLFRNILIMELGGASFNHDTELRENFRLLCREFGPMSPEFLQRLYELKYYRNWHERTLEDVALLQLLYEASEVSEDLEEAIRLCVAQRKTPPNGKILPSQRENRKRIAICLAWLSGCSGGAERIAVETANALHRRGYAVSLVCIDGFYGGPYYRVDPGVSVINLGIYPYSREYFIDKQDVFGPLSKWTKHAFPKLKFVPRKREYDEWSEGFARYAANLYRVFFEKHDFDVVFSHMPSTWLQVLAARPENDTAWHVACLHNAPNFKFYSLLYDAPGDTERYMRIATLDKADEITIIFEEFRDQLPEHLSGKARVLPNYSSFDPIEEYVDRSQAKTILSVGRLVPQKNHKDLLRAFSKIQQKYPDWRLKIYGDGELKDELMSFADELGLDPAGIFQGARSDIENAYKNATIFAFPSLFEGFGLAAAEAMSFGLPVVAFKECEGARNLFVDGESGLLVERDLSLDALTDALTRLVEDAAFREKLGRGALEAARAFSFDRTIAVLEDIIAGAPDRSRRITPPKAPEFSVGLVTSFAEGGAGIAKKRVSEALNLVGIESFEFSLSQSTSPTEYTLQFPPGQDPNFFPQIQIDMSVHDGGTAYSIMYPGIPNEQLYKLLDCDVINLHWVSRLLTPEQVTWLASTGRPVVWTLHDMNPFTGGCHYSNDCNGYQKDCRNCPQLTDTFSDFPSRLLRSKMVMPDSITLVAPSRWLADCARKSAVFANNRIEVIPNGVDTSRFTPIDRTEAKQHFGLSPSKRILLFACNSLSERRKGLSELLKSVEHIPDFATKFHVILLGSGDEIPVKLKSSFTPLGFIQGSRELNRVYNAADLMILPSLEDNLPNVILEAAACGTPTLAFDAGGIAEAVIDDVTGWTVPRGDIRALALAIQYVNPDQLRGRARAYAVENWSLEKLGANYSSLFKELLGRADPSHKIRRYGSVIPSSETSPHLAAMMSTFRFPAAGNSSKKKDFFHRLEKKLSKPEGRLSWKVFQTIRLSVHRIRDFFRVVRRQPQVKKSSYIVRNTFREIRSKFGWR
ncbi:glycosyltransferase [uncultured Martelella sp.]|uniref:glycosyltransferase n=1 Tax=uncultured Martelella sp. TaxID=392331 RepID=UPI0029C6DE02|nr:glycosyltransferase [uncultured Martelella sp.]